MTPEKVTRVLFIGMEQMDTGPIKCQFDAKRKGPSEFLTANSEKEILAAIQKYDELAAVVFVGCIADWPFNANSPTGHLHALPALKAKFGGKAVFITASTYAVHNEIMMKAGCDHALRAFRLLEELPDLVPATAPS